MDESEWNTRQRRSDTRLRSQNPPGQLIPWRTGLDLSTLHCHAVTEFPTANGLADYARFISGALLGIIEAKKVTISPQNVLEQAKRYAAGVTPSLLAKAFRGELVPQGPNDENSPHPFDVATVVREQLTALYQPR